MTAPRPPDDSLRDPVLDAAWNAHSIELPPARIDAAILAAAHREAKSRPQALGEDDGSTHARRPARAWWGLAAAATIGAIAFSVIQLAPPAVQKSDPMVASDVPPTTTSPSPREGVAATEVPSPPAVPAAPSGRVAMSPDETNATPQASRPRAEAEATRKSAKVARADRPAAATEAPMQSPDTNATSRDQAQRADAARTLQDRSASGASNEPRVAAMAPPPPAAMPSPRPFPGSPPPVVAEAAPAPGAAQSPADAAKAETSNAFAARRAAPTERMGAMTAPQAGAAVTPKRQRDAASPPLAKSPALTPEAWIERIRSLHAQQRLDDAARELNAFREAYPDADARLPASLAAWAAGVKRNTP